jgi:hypothetical protein
MKIKDFIIKLSKKYAYYIKNIQKQLQNIAIYVYKKKKKILLLIF